MNKTKLGTNDLALSHTVSFQLSYTLLVEAVRDTTLWKECQRISCPFTSARVNMLWIPAITELCQVRSCTKQSTQSSEERYTAKRQSELEPVTKREVLFMGSRENLRLPRVGEGKKDQGSSGSPLLAPQSRRGPCESVQSLWVLVQTLGDTVRVCSCDYGVIIADPNGPVLNIGGDGFLI